MIGKHVANFQVEISGAKKLQECEFASPMAYGYPAGVYHPTVFIERTHVSRILSDPVGKICATWHSRCLLRPGFPIGVSHPCEIQCEMSDEYHRKNHCHLLVH